MGSVFVPLFVMQYMQYCVSFLVVLIILMEKRERERAGCFTLIVFLMSCSATLPHGAMVLYTMCDSGISWSYSLTFSTNTCSQTTLWTELKICNLCVEKAMLV